MLKIVTECEMTMLEFDPEFGEVSDLADLYIERGIIPRKNRSDALHVAVATVAGMDAVVTWNFKHLAGVDREDRISSINRGEGLHKPIRLITPMEVAYP